MSCNLTKPPAVIVAAILLTVACGGQESPTDPEIEQNSVDLINVTPETYTLTALGSTLKYEAVALTSEGDTVSDVTFNWSSTNEAVATVDSAGMATAQANGETGIVAATQNVTGEASLVINQAIDGLAYSTEPTSAIAGEVIDPFVQVSVLDSAGNIVEDAESGVTISIGTNPGDGSLGGSTTVNAVDGVATFSDLWIDKAASGYTLDAAANGVGDTARSQAFEISAAAASQLAIMTEPSAVEGQEPISPAVEVEALDEFGNPVTSWSESITMAVADDPTTGDAFGGGASLLGTATVGSSDGVATFSNLILARPGIGFTLEATASGLTAATSRSFDVHLTFVQIGTSRGNIAHTCGVTSANHVFCWGSNSWGALGDGTNTGRSRPVGVVGGNPFAQVSVSRLHTCAVTTANEVFCWGRNSTGQLGDGTTTDRWSPVRVDVSGLPTQTFAQVSTRSSYTCGVTTADEPYCWGHNHAGQLGDGTTTDRLTPEAVDVSGLPTQTFATISGGHEHTCGVTTANEPYCWGNNNNGELGDATTSDHLTPEAVVVSDLSTPTFSQVSAGLNHTCGLTTADEPYCWGDNSSGQLGDGTTTDRLTPEAVDVSGLPTQTFATISAGRQHTCAITTADELYCWGDNSSGQLGDGTTQVRLTPEAVKVSDLSTSSFDWVSAGYQHTCGVTTTNEAYCWGTNDDGELGDGTTNPALTPVRVIQ